MKVIIQLKETSQPLEYDAINSYQKGHFYCIYTEDGLIYNFPIMNIWRVVEDYGFHGRNIKENKDQLFNKDKTND